MGLSLALLLSGGVAHADISKCSKAISGKGAVLQGKAVKAFTKCIGGYHKAIIKGEALSVKAAPGCQKQLDKEIKALVRKAEDDYDDMERAIRKKERMNDNQVTKMRSRTATRNQDPALQEVQEALNAALSRQKQYTAWAQRNTLEVQNLESQIDLLGEKADQLEEEKDELEKRAKLRR